MRSFDFFNNKCIKIQISSFDETAELVEELARLLSLEPSRDPGGIRVIVYSLDCPPVEISRIQQRAGLEAAWRSYDVLSRVLIHESPDGSVLLCGLRRYPSWYPTQEVKWFLMSMVVEGIFTILSDRFLLIHGALITNGYHAYVLTGPSGVGKSTAASRVPPPWSALADDLIAAVATQEGYDLLPLPTWSQLVSNPETFQPPELNRSYRLSGIYFLEQAGFDAIESIPPPNAIARLFHNSCAPYHLNHCSTTDEDRLRIKSDILKHVTRILDRTPCEVLKVSLEGRFWEQFPTR